MSKSSISSQMEALLEQRGRWLSAGGDNLVHYLSARLRHTTQVDELHTFFADPPEHFHVERDGRRVLRVGLAKWLETPAVETDELPADGWELVNWLYEELAKQVRAYGDLQDELELERSLTPPVFVAESATQQPIVVSTECADCTPLRKKVEALKSVVANNREVVAGLRSKLNTAERDKRTAEQALDSLRTEYEQVEICHNELHRIVETHPIGRLLFGH